MRSAHADTPPRTYEAQLVDRALAELNREAAVDSSGLRIREILILPQDIIHPDDPYPTILNAIHVTTRASVIERELLFARGDVYDPALIAETERNLRRLPILAAARILPLRTDEPGTVDVLVVTRDLWSIRFESSFNLVGSLLQYLRIRPTEHNFGGRDKKLGLDFEYTLGTLAVGQQYLDRRIFGTRLSFEEQARIIWNRATGKVEGTTGGVRLHRPLYSLRTSWGFESQVTWAVRRARLFQGPNVRTLDVPGGGTVPWVYDQRALDAVGLYTRSFGSAFKVNVSVGPGFYTHRSIAPEGVTAAELAVLQARALPRSEDAAFLAGRLNVFAAEYRVLRNFRSFALSEDYQVGPLLRVDLRAGRFLRSGAFTEGGAAGRYQVVIGDSLTSASVAGAIRHCVPDCSGEVWVNRRFAAELSHVTPTLGPGRFAVRGTVELRSHDLDRTLLQLGGGNGLRGTAPESQSGARLLLFNAEYRTLPMDLWTLHLGGVLFWDAGAAWTSGRPEVVHTVGLGIRALFPQLDVEPFRFDFGHVLNGVNPAPAERYSASFGQVTRYRPKMLDQPLE